MSTHCSCVHSKLFLTSSCHRPSYKVLPSSLHAWCTLSSSLAFPKVTSRRGSLGTSLLRVCAPQLVDAVSPIRSTLIRVYLVSVPIMASNQSTTPPPTLQRGKACLRCRYFLYFIIHQNSLTMLKRALSRKRKMVSHHLIILMACQSLMKSSEM